ncbi:MAG: hypothetical protein AAGA30_02310 [Planctomycetota bacterium]
MAIRTLTPPRIQLQKSRFGPELFMDLEQFFEFSFWIAEELIELETEFTEWQTPATVTSMEFDANGLPEDIDFDFDEI